MTHLAAGSAQRHLAPASAASDARTVLQLTRLVDDIEREHPELSGPLRLTLLRAHRDGQVGWLDTGRFIAVAEDLCRHASARGSAPTPAA